MKMKIKFLNELRNKRWKPITSYHHLFSTLPIFQRPRHLPNDCPVFLWFPCGGDSSVDVLRFPLRTPSQTQTTFCRDHFLWIDLQSVDGLVVVHRPNLQRKERRKIMLSLVRCLPIYLHWPISIEWVKLLPWSIRHMNKTPNIPSFHSILGQLFHPSPNQKEKVRKIIGISWNP